MKEGASCNCGGCCGVCRWLLPLILSATALLLLLANLGVLTGGFAEWVVSWWPAGVLVYALGGFCPCKSCKMDDKE